MSSTWQVKAMLRDYACRHGQTPVIELLQRTPVKEFFCHQKLNRVTQARDEAGQPVQLIDGKQQELVEKRVYYLSSDHPKPGPYRATGWVKSHPKTQQITFLIDTLEPQTDDFEGFRVSEHVEDLRAFQALSWAAKLSALTERVTRIYERDEILLATLLTYCAPRWLPFNGEIIRGWLVTAVVGDAGTGKSQTTQRLAEFVDIVDTFSGLTGSRTGLSYALVEHQQKGWQVKIGRYPANSRKLLIVDEAQHLPDWDVRTLAKAMEEGFLQVDRVQSKGYESQTRLILIANPKKDRIMDTFAFGCEALKTLFPPMILRRVSTWRCLPTRAICRTYPLPRSRSPGIRHAYSRRKACAPSSIGPGRSRPNRSALRRPLSATACNEPKPWPVSTAWPAISRSCRRRICATSWPASPPPSPFFRSPPPTISAAYTLSRSTWIWRRSFWTPFTRTKTAASTSIPPSRGAPPSCETMSRSLRRF